MSHLHLHLAGTHFDFSYLPRIVSAFAPSGQVVPLKIWRKFKFYTEEDVFQRLRPLLSTHRVSDKDLHYLCNLVQGRSRSWVLVFSSIVEKPHISFTDLCSSILTTDVSYLFEELSRLCGTDSNFISDRANYYMQLLFNRM